MNHYGLIEAGGTKFVLGIAEPSHTIIARHRIPTTTPAEVLPAGLRWDYGDSLLNIRIILSHESNPAQYQIANHLFRG